ncbi:MAG: hypothetical protein V1872_01970 [bacterium]
MGLTERMSNIGQIAFDEGEREGKKEGKKEGIIESIKEYLLVRFDKVPDDILTKFKKIKDLSKLEKIIPRIYRCKDLDEIGKLL